MARKLLESKSFKGTTTKVYYDNDFDEYVVILFRSMRRIRTADYFTQDKDDALITARIMRERISNAN